MSSRPRRYASESGQAHPWRVDTPLVYPNDAGGHLVERSRFQVEVAPLEREPLLGPEARADDKEREGPTLRRQLIGEPLELEEWFVPTCPDSMVFAPSCGSS